MPRRTKAEALETRNTILDAAIDVFFEKGVNSSSLNDIARKAKVTRGAIYWHFKNKLHIFSALHDQLYSYLADTIFQDLQNDHPHPLLQLERLCTELIIELQHDQNRFKALSIVYLRCDYSGEMGQFLEQQNVNRQRTINLFSSYFERAKLHGHLPNDINPQTLSAALLAYISGIVIEYIRSYPAIDLDTEGAGFMRLFFRNMG